MRKPSRTCEARRNDRRRTDPLSHTEQFAYDGNDNLTQFIDRKGQTTNYTYDPLNRRTQATYPDATATYTYDSVDRLTQINDTQGGTITRGYDTLDRLIQEVTPQGQINYSYDAANRRTSMTVAGQPAAAYTYDAANRLTGITRGSETVALSYDSASRRASLTLPNGVVATYGYNAANQLTSINYAKSGTPVGDLSYAYDLAGQRVKMGGSLARMGLPDPVASATYNAANQLTSWDGVAHTYDANGNLTVDTSRTLTWDGRNRLASLSGPVTGNFSYDAMGRRKSKTVAGTSTSFLYDGLNIVQELNGATPQANLLTGQGIDEVFARTSAGGSENFVTDGLGSTVALTDAAGAVQTSYTYETYGKAEKSGTATTNSQTYTGREDDGTGLYYYRARYYNPTISRFVLEDPIGLRGGINSYAYVEGNPVKFTDPSGLAAGDLPPPPPGYNPSTWSQGYQDNSSGGRWFVTDPEGKTYYAHDEDVGHWRHWDDDDNNRWPPNSKKPWPNQKRKPKPDQCATDPNGDAPPWKPNDPSKFDSDPFFPGMYPPSSNMSRVPTSRVPMFRFAIP